jgi:YVTN family beta-propeller protein
MTVAFAVPLVTAAATAGLASAAGGYTVTATIPVGSDPTAAAADPAAGTVYVTNSKDGTVSVIDAATNAVTATIAVGSDPDGVAVDPAAGTVYVANYGDNTVSVVNAATNAVTATIMVGSDPTAVAVDPAAGTVYVTNFKDGTVSVINEATNTVTDTITIPAIQGVGEPAPVGVALDPAAGTVYVTNIASGPVGDGMVSVIDVATNAVTATISVYVGNDPDGVAVDPATGTVYLVNGQWGTVSVIDVATNAVTATIGVGDDPNGAVAVDPAAGTVYVTNGYTLGGECENKACLAVIDAATNAVTDTVPIAPDRYAQGVAVDPTTHTAYVTNASASGAVSVISSGKAPAITGAASASIGMRSPAHVTVTATGIPAPALTETGALPSGITFTDNGNGTATISGIASAGTAGRYPITVTASNGVGSPATRAFTLSVTAAASAPAITSARVYTALFGLLFGLTVTTNGYPAPLFSETGKIPPGVYFAGNGDGTATISGVPDRTALGPYTLKLTAANRAGKATQSFLLIIQKPPVIAKVPATTATIGKPMHLAMTATGYPTPTLTESGTLPRGLRFTSTGHGHAAITGTPAPGTAGGRAITITAATNQVGATSQTFILTVRPS